VWNLRPSRLHTVVPFRPADARSAATIALVPEFLLPHRAAADRYADAVRSRRAELRTVRAMLLGGHRVELRHTLTASRLTASAELAAALASLGRELRHHAAHANRAGRAAVPALAAAAVAALVDRVVAGWATAVLPGLRRLAAPRCVPGTLPGPAGALEPVVTVLARRPSITLPGPDPPPSAAGALLAGVTGGTWRLALVPAAVLPAVGLPALGGRALLPPALGIALALLITAARAHRTAEDRARLRRWADDVVMVVRSELDTELARRLIDVERVAAAELDELVARRLDLIDTELRAIAAGG
jgi:hypothetical protein